MSPSGGRWTFDVELGQDLNHPEAIAQVNEASYHRLCLAPEGVYVETSNSAAAQLVIAQKPL